MINLQCPEPWTWNFVRAILADLTQNSGFNREGPALCWALERVAARAVENYLAELVEFYVAAAGKPDAYQATLQPNYGFCVEVKT